MSDLEKLRAGICLHFYENTPIKGDISLNYYIYDSDVKYHTGYALIGDENDPIQVVFSMPNKSNEVYMMVTDGNPVEMASELSGLQHYNEEKEHICLFHTVPTMHKYVTNEGWDAYLTLRPITVLKGFNDSAEIMDREINFRLVVPITKEERDYKIKHDMEALLDKFEEEDRDIISFERK